MNSNTPERYCQFCWYYSSCSTGHICFGTRTRLPASVYANVLIAHYQKAKIIDFFKGI